MTTLSGVRTAEHEVTVDAPASEVFRLLADVESWSRLFPPTVHVQPIERRGSEERIRIWATANGEAKTWTSRRVLDPAAARIDFRQEVSSPPVGAMGGSWLVESLSASVSRVRLLHDYRAVDADPRNVAWVDQAVDRNSRTELEALKRNVELGRGDSDGLLMSFTDTVPIHGSAKDVYDFLYEAQLWEARLPHVARVALHEDEPGLQVLEMDTRTKDGSTHTTKSVRVCFPHSRIVYKQTTLPALLALHTGYWQIDDDAAGARATSQHTVVLNPGAVAQVLGPDADLKQARAFVRNALSGNSRATLDLAVRYAYGRR